MNRKSKMVLAILLAASLCLSGMDGVAVHTEAASKKATVKLNKSQVSLKKGKKVTLKIVTKNVKKIVSVKWSSKNKKTATVSSKGKVTAKAAGKSTVITCNVKYMTADSEKVKGTKLQCKVKVKKASTQPSQPTQPVQSGQPAQASPSAQPVQSTQPGQASPSVQPTEPAQTTQPAQTSQPTQSVQPAPTADSSQEKTALIPEIMKKTKVEQNPYLSSEESMIHNDIYNSDVTEKAMPLGIYPEIVESVASDSPISPPTFFYDNYGNAIAPYSQIMEDGTVLSGGIAIRDMDSSDVRVLGKFQPPLHDHGAKYGIQISYSFVDKENYLVGPTTHGHVIMVQTYDGQGNILPVFRKKLDVDIVSGAVSILGDEIDKNLLSIAYDYEGNLWFVTGGFHKNPSHSKAGFVGYLEREYIDRVLAGEGVADVSGSLHSMIVPKGSKTLAINPLNWETDGTAADKSLNLGACFTDYDGKITKEINHLTGAYIDDVRGALKVTDVKPKEYPAGLEIFEEGIYHLYDYQFFYRNLQKNVKTRIDAYLN